MLRPEEYDASYFDGALQRFSHNAGYSTYQRWYRNEVGSVRGEFWADLAYSLTKEFDLIGKRALEVGCAKGFLVASLRSEAVDARGVDVSEYAISQAEREVRPYIKQANILDAVRGFADMEFDFLISRQTLECFSDRDLDRLVPELNRIALRQLHIVCVDPRPDFYNPKSLAEWRQLEWSNAEIRN